MHSPSSPFVKTSQSQLEESDRRIILETMRKRLAGPSQTLAHKQEKRRLKVQRSRMATTAQVLAVTLLIAGNGWFAFQNRGQITQFIREHALPLLPSPTASLSPDEEALYWTYALYDFPKLKQRFRVGDRVVIDNRLASSRLRELMPVVGQATIAEISLYVAPGGPR